MEQNTLSLPALEKRAEALAAQLVASLRSCGKTVAAAESCTGGLFAKYITDIPGSSAVLEGSVVTYANRIKTQFCGVREETLRAYGAVSEQVAQQMACGIRACIGADFGIGITGLAGPGGASAEKPVGLVYLGCADAARCTVLSRVTVPPDGYDPTSARAYVRTASVCSAMELLLRMLDDEGQNRERSF